MAQIELIVDVPKGLNSGSWPVTTGVPFPDEPASAWADGDAISVCLGKQTVPTQTRVLSRWPSGRVRWLLVDFQTSASKPGAGYTLQDRPTVPPETPLILSVPTATSDAPYRITTGDPGRLAYVTRRGPLELRLGSVNGTGRWTPALPAPIEFRLRAGGEPYLAHLDEDGPAVEVEEEGPLRIALCARGWFVRGDGDRFCRFEVRFHFFAGSPLVRILHTFVYTDACAARKVEALSIEVPFAEGLERRCGTDASDFAASEAIEASLRRVLSPVREPASRVEAHTGVIESLPQPAANWCSVGGSQGAGFAVAQRDAWRNAPNGVRFEADRLSFELWPDDGDPLDLSPGALVERSYGGEEGLSKFRPWYYVEIRLDRNTPGVEPQGVAKTHEVWLDTWEDADFAERGSRLGLAVDHPVFGLAEPGHNCRSGALGPLHPQDRTRFPAEEAALEALFDSYLRFEIHWRTYGWLIHGDVQTNALVKSGGNAGVARLSEFRRVWEASHYGFPKVPWLLFYRSGRRDYLEFAEANARHVMDVDRCHFGDLPELEERENGSLWIADSAFDAAMDLFPQRLKRFRGHHFWDEGTPLIGDGPPLISNYEVLEFLAYPYYFRGEARSASVLQDWYAALHHFHPVDDPRAGIGRFLKLMYRPDQLNPGDRYDDLRHIAPPIGNLVELARMSLFQGPSPTEQESEWAAVLGDYLDTALSFPPADLDESEFRASEQKLRHAWGGLANALRLLADLRNTPFESLFAGELETELGAQILGLAYRAATSNRLDTNQSYEDLVYGYALASAQSDAESQRQAEDFLDLARARLDLLLSRVNVETCGIDGDTDPDDPRAWRTPYGPRGSSSESTIRHSYALQSVPYLLRTLADADVPEPDSRWFRLVGPRMPRVRCTVTQPEWRLKLHLGREQGGWLRSAGDEELSLEKARREDAPALVELDSATWVAEGLSSPAVGDELLLEMDVSSVLEVGMLPIQRAFVDILRVEGLRLEIVAEEESLANWKRAGAEPLPEERYPMKVFRVFGRFFWFDVPADAKRVVVTAYVGLEQGFKAFDPVLRLWKPGGNTDGNTVENTAENAFVTATLASRHQSDQVPELTPLTVEAAVTPELAGAWSFGPIAHITDPFRKRVHDPNEVVIDQREAERAGDAGFPTWVTVELHHDETGSDIRPVDGLRPAAPLL